MARNWLTIVGIVAAAAMTGWLVTTLVGGSASKPAERTALPGVEISRGEPADGEPADTEAGEGAAQEIERDLAVLAQILRLDQTVEATVLPQAVAELGMRSPSDYRNPVRFWQPAFAAAKVKR